MRVLNRLPGVLKRKTRQTGPFGTKVMKVSNRLLAISNSIGPGFHSDNGGEFLNHHLIRYFHDRHIPVDYSRGRPYHKNDTAHVEQKNYIHVRLLLGCQRIEQAKLIG